MPRRAGLLLVVLALVSTLAFKGRSVGSGWLGVDRRHSLIVQ